MSLEPSTFFSDVVIVCTVAILIGQDLRGGLKEAIENKKREIRECVDSLIKGKDYIEDESIKEIFDQVKNYNTPDLWYYPMMFYVGIMLALLLSLISMNQQCEAYVIECLKNCPVEKLRFWLQTAVFITLFAYGWRLISMHNGYNKFNKQSYNFVTNLQLIDKMVQKNGDHSTPIAPAPKRGRKQQ